MQIHSDTRIDEYERAGVWGDVTLLDRFDDVAAGQPDRTAVVDPPNRPELVGGAPERLTYAEFHSRVDAIAADLRDRGVGKDDVVVVQLPNTWELAALYLAVARAGAVISPLPVQWRRREIEHVVEITGAEVIVAVEEFNGFDHAGMAERVVEDLPTLRTVVTLDDVRGASEREVDQAVFGNVDVGANEVFNLQWTSGTTADPKACPMSHNNWAANFVPPLTDMSEGGRLLCLAPLVNMTALGVLYVPWLLTRGTLVLHHPIDAELLVEQLMGEDITFTIMVPTLLNRLLKHPKVDAFDFSGIETIATGSAAPAAWTLAEFKDRWDIEIINIWGQNEGTGIVSGPRTTPLSRRATDFPQFRTDVDWGIDDPRVTTIDTKIVDPETGEEVTEIGERGELAYRGPFTMGGYFNQPELTEKAFDDDGFFYTGDLFEVEPDDFISFFDRKKDVVIRGGYTISAKEVENVALQHEHVADAAVVAMPDPELGERVAIYVVPNQGESVALEDVTSLMEDEIAIYKHPERLELVEEIPRNPVGKVLKTELRADIQEKGAAEETPL